MTPIEYRIKQRRARRIEREKRKSMQYYNEHKEEIELCRQAELIVWTLSRIIPVKLEKKDILLKATPNEIKYYARWCMQL